MHPGNGFLHFGGAHTANLLKQQGLQAFGTGGKIAKGLGHEIENLIVNRTIANAAITGSALRLYGDKQT